jgi:hypothetical protein
MLVLGSPTFDPQIAGEPLGPKNSGKLRPNALQVEPIARAGVTVSAAASMISRASSATSLICASSSSMRTNSPAICACRWGDSEQPSPVLNSSSRLRPAQRRGSHAGPLTRCTRRIRSFVRALRAGEMAGDASPQSMPDQVHGFRYPRPSGHGGPRSDRAGSPRRRAGCAGGFHIGYCWTGMRASQQR